MKKIWQTSRKILAFFLVWMLTEVGPVQEFRLFSGGLIATAAAVDARLPDCKDYQPDTESGHASGGDKCTVSDVGIEDGDGWMISEGYVSILLTWAVAMIFMYQVLRCRTPNVSCGYSTIFSSIGAIALFAGEIAAIVGFATKIGDIKKKVEYRPDQIRNMQDQCAAGGVSSGSGSGSIDDISACDQLDYIKAQREALDGAKTAATWKYGLAIAAAVAFGIAAIIELVGWITGNIHDAVITAIGTATETGIPAAAASCTGPQAAACTTACAACETGVVAGQAAFSSYLIQQNSLAPTASEIDCTKIRYTVGVGHQSASAACMAATGAAVACFTAAQAYINALQEKLVELYCPNNNACILACEPIGIVGGVVQNFRNEHYDISRKTCGLESNHELQLENAYADQLQDPSFAVTQFPDIFFRPADSNSSLLIINDEEVQREVARTQTVVDLKLSQEKLSLNDYRKIRQFYGEEMFVANNFDFLKMLVNSAVAADKKDDKNEDSGMPVNQVIGGSIGLAAMAITIFIGLLKTADVAADNAFSTPARRTGWNTLAAALATTQAIYTKLAVINILQEHIDTIDGILAMKAISKNSVQTPGSTDIPYTGVVVGDEFFETPPPLPGDQKYPCPAGGDGKGGCKEIASAVDASLGAVDLSSLAGLAGTLKSLNNGIAGRQTMGKGTLNSASTLAAAARGIKKKIGDLQKKINMSRAKNKQAPIDFAGNQSKALKGLFKQTKDYLAAKGVTAESLMPPSPVEPVAAKDLEKKLAEDTKGKAVAVAAITATTPDLGNFNFNDTEPAALQAGAETAATSAQIDETFQVPNNDIGSDANTDIFQMLSSRYLKTAYPILFEEEKTPAKAP